MRPYSRAALLRASVEEAAHAPAAVSEVTPGRLRITVPISDDLSLSDFRRALDAVRVGDDWGSSSDEDGTVTVWSEIASDPKRA